MGQSKLASGVRRVCVGLYISTSAIGAGSVHASEALLDALRAADVAGVSEALAQADFDATVADTDGTTALAWAVHHDMLDLSAALLAAGAPVDAANRFGIRPLYLASENGSARMLRLLLDHGADPAMPFPEGETALMTAARTGNVDAVAVLLEAGAQVDAQESWKGQTALMWAAHANNDAVLRQLIDAGADVHLKSTSGDFTALTFAVRAGAIEATRALLDADADVDAVMADGTSMLVLATTNAHYEVAGLLADRGADPNAAAQGWTALHQIAWSRRWNRGFNLPGPARTGGLNGLDLARKLVAAGADVNARQTAEPADGNRNKMDRIGATPFLLAAKSCDVSLMRVLLELGADASISTQDGTTAVMAAAGVGIWAPGENPGSHEDALAAVRLAYESGGGAVSDINDHGDTVIHGAVYRGGAVSVIEYLAGLGAPLELVNELGWSPLIAAEGVEYTPDVLKRYPEAAATLRRLIAERAEQDGLPQ